MLGLFKPRLPVDRDEFEWLLACFAWYLREFDGIDGLRGSPLVLPTTDFFPRSDLQGHARAVELFDRVRDLAGMREWQCDLVAGASDANPHIATGHLLRRRTEAQPLRTFSYQHGRYLITYNPVGLADPETLVATFAHELAHYLMHTASGRPPGGGELEEHATDLAAVFLGFGVFMANSAKNFRQFQTHEEMGWEMRAAGYLSELARITGLAIFVRLKGADAGAAERALKDYLRGPFRKALAAIDRECPDLAATIAAVDLAEWR
ncbi:MAG: hypothetical protein V4574_19385 [Pseudomonadota bacterium]